MISNTNLLDVILISSTASSALRRRPSSKAEIIVIALASPIPLKFINCEMDIFPKTFKLSALAKILLLKSTADSFRLPEPIKIAINSASLKAFLPLSINFSRGRSSSDQFVMGK
ncbi:hypothetical protein D3C84_1004030 [compost metagenome]